MENYLTLDLQVVVEREVSPGRNLVDGNFLAFIIEIRRSKADRFF
jgi:hypothetical protein